MYEEDLLQLYEPYGGTMIDPDQIEKDIDNDEDFKDDKVIMIPPPPVRFHMPAPPSPKWPKNAFDEVKPKK